jgi:hypothetical protein
MSSKLLTLVGCTLLITASLQAADQTQVGAGNALAEQIAAGSSFVRSAKERLLENGAQIKDQNLRLTTLDAINNPNTCVTHRVGITDAVKNTILQNLETAALVNPADASAISGGVKAGVFPPILNEGTNCPHLPLSFNAAPGSAFHGHHSYPGGLPVHEANNDQSDINFAGLYRGSYGTNGLHNLPVVSGEQLSLFSFFPQQQPDLFINQDVILAAPMWHDWGKTLVFQWNGDGSEFTELNFGGTGTNDAWGAPGDSRTGGHHIISIAESMKRRLSPELVITQASAHSAPTSGNEYKVVNWLNAAAIMAQIDPVAKGYLTRDSQGRLRLPAVRQLGNGVNLTSSLSTENLLVEYALHNLSDSDFNLSGPAVTTAETVLAAVAGMFGYNPNAADLTQYNTRFRNVVLSQLSAERLLIIYGNAGLPGVTAELQKLHQLGII